MPRVSPKLRVVANEKDSDSNVRAALVTGAVSGATAATDARRTFTLAFASSACFVLSCRTLFFWAAFA